MTTAAMATKQEQVAALLGRAPVVPVLVIEDLEAAVPLAEALVAGGLVMLEITLRSEVALAAIERVAQTVPHAVVGAGTVTDAAQLTAVQRAGAQFAVSPGVSDALLTAASESSLPLLPGAATASEIMNLMAHGYRYLKFFPANVVGGAPALKALSGPLPDIRFCPTGGISQGNARDYLSLPNVVAVGGSWVAPAEKVAAGDWAAVTALAAKAAALRTQR